MTTSTPVSPQRATTTEVPDQRVEAWLNSHSAKFEFRPIQLASINKEKSHKNQSRFTALDNDTVAIYKEAMERGDRFPGIVVWLDKGKYVVVDGNHRVESKEQTGAEHIGAYVLEGVSERQTQTMTFEANARHGLPASVAERTAHGVYLVGLGVEQGKAAAMVNIPVPNLHRALAQSRGEARMARLGLTRTDNIASSARARLNNIRSDAVFKAAAELAIDASLSSNVVDELVTAVNKVTGSEADQLAFIAKQRDVYAPVIAATAGGRIPTATDLTRLMRSLTYAENINQDLIGAATAPLSQEERVAIGERISRAVVLLMTTKQKLGG